MTAVDPYSENYLESGHWTAAQPPSLQEWNHRPLEGISSRLLRLPIYSCFGTRKHLLQDRLPTNFNDLSLHISQMTGNYNRRGRLTPWCDLTARIQRASQSRRFYLPTLFYCERLRSDQSSSDHTVVSTAKEDAGFESCQRVDIFFLLNFYELAGRKTN